MFEKIIVVRRYLVFIFLFFMINNVYAQNYIYAEMEILDNGVISVNGESNIDLEIEGLRFLDNKISGKTQMLTSKSRDTWNLNLDFKETYSDVFITIYFPENTRSIKNINSDLNSNINLGNRISIEIKDYNKPVVFSVDYSIEGRKSKSWIIILVLSLIILALSFLLVRKRKKEIKKLDILLPVLNEKERDIVRLLMKKPMRQKNIRKNLDIPKASFSRYMINLENKKIIIREGEGKNKLVKLK